ncbi:MAG: pantetheine-phosphate adenylyltransferase [Chitinophagales bacterium]
MKRIAIFPGSFDPITIGHVDILQRALPLFEKIVVAIGTNSQKKYFFSLEERLSLIEKVFENEPKIEVQTYSGLTANFATKIGAGFLLRGVRNATDFEFEKTIAQLNKELEQNLETILLVCKPKYSHISSTIVREILIHKGKAEKFLPKAIQTYIVEKM